MLKPTPYRVEVLPALGMNTDQNPTQLPQGAQRIAYDACMKEVNTIGKRPGSAPVTTVALPNTILHMTTYKTSPSDVVPQVLAVSGSSLHKYTGTEFSPITMTNTFNGDVYTTNFTDNMNVSSLLIADTGTFKEYNGTEVKTVVAAADDPTPAPPNSLFSINLRGPKYVWEHQGHVFLSDGTDMLWYSKRYTKDYFPSVQYYRLVKQNDYVNGCGVSYNSVCLIPMRRGWSVITGETFDDGVSSNPFKANQYLNTLNGVIAPRSIVKITYPDGAQTVAYLSDDGMHEIYDTGIEEMGSRQYSTRSLMNGKLDFEKFGFSDTAKKKAFSYFDITTNRLLVTFTYPNPLGGVYGLTLVYDVRNLEWYIWRTPYIINAFVLWENGVYMGNNTNYLYKFDESLYSDWSNTAHTVGTPVDFDVYSGLMSFEFSGDSSYLHYYLVEAQIYNVPSTLDVYIIYGAGMVQLDSALVNEIFVWGVTEWDSGMWGNLNYSDNVNNAKRLVIKKKAKYFQRRWRNNRDEPVLILKESFIGTLSGR